jgi:beta-mannosidase
MLWWNVRDGWPIISDAIVDYYNRKKLAYEYLKRIQTDVCVIYGEPARGKHKLFAVNDTREPVRGHVTLRDADGGKPKLKASFKIPANGRVEVGTVKASAKPAMWLIDWSVNDGAADRNHYLAGPRPFKLSDYRRWLTALEIPADVGPERSQAIPRASSIQARRRR